MKEQNMDYVKKLIDEYQMAEKEIRAIDHRLTSPQNKLLCDPDYGSIAMDTCVLFLTEEDLNALIRVRRRKMDELVEKMKDL